MQEDIPDWQRLLNAVKELAAENDTLKQKLTEQQANAAAQQQQLQRQINEQRQEMAAIKQLLCATQPQADLCKTKLVK